MYKLNDNFLLKDTGYSNALQNTSYPRHRWFSFKEAFSPNLVEFAIKSCDLPRGSLVLDPFCGSGTTCLTATSHHMKSIGIEVNPFLSLVSECKCTNFSPNEFNDAVSYILLQASKGNSSAIENVSTFSELSGKEKWLFNSEVLRAFNGGWQASKLIPDNISKPIKLGLITAALENCNAFKDGKCLRYKRDWKSIGFSRFSFVRSLSNIYDMIKDDILATHLTDNLTTIINQDCRSFLKNRNTPFEFDLCVTSPPYLNSFDYSDIYRPELFLGEFVKNNSELMKIRLKTLRSHIQANWDTPICNDFGMTYEKSISAINERVDSLWNKKIPIMIQAYFEDIRSILSNLRKVSSRNASLWFIVSTSAYAGIEVPVDLILAEIGTATGWFLKEIGVLRYLRTSGQHFKRFSQNKSSCPPQLRESLVIFESVKNTTRRQFIV